MTSSVSLTLELAVLILAAALLFAYWQLGRREERVLAKRVDRAVQTPVAGHKAAEPGRASARIVTAPPWLRLPFVFGIRRTWGMTLTTLWTMLFAVVGAILAWLQIGRAHV